MADLVDSDTAAGILGVKTRTLYAYVSRGQLTAHRRAGSNRSWFDPAEVDALLQRGRSQEAAPRRAGVVMESAVTLISEGRYWYRGHDPLHLARTSSFEQVAELLWSGSLPARRPSWPPSSRPAALDGALTAALAPAATPTDRLRAAVPLLAAADPFRHDTRPEAVPAVGRRLIADLVALLHATGPDADRRDADRRDAAGRDAAGQGAGVAARLWPALADRPPGAGDLAAVDAALVVMADHELAASTAAVRIAASFRADPYAAMSAGLAVVSGALHGRASALVERLLDEVDRRHDAELVVSSWLASGEQIPGLGQPVYPEGDPRARHVLDLADRHRPGDAGLARVRAVLDVTGGLGLPPANVDLALAALLRAMGCRPGSAELVFTVARLAGWLAHAAEEYAHRSDLRLRALYTGPRPRPDDDGAPGPS